MNRTDNSVLTDFHHQSIAGSIWVHRKAIFDVENAAMDVRWTFRWWEKWAIRSGPVDYGGLDTGLHPYWLRNKFFNPQILGRTASKCLNYCQRLAVGYKMTELAFLSFT